VAKLAVMGDVGIGRTDVDNAQEWARTLTLTGGPHAKLLVTETTAGVKTGIFSHSSWGGAVGRIGTESWHDLRLMAGYGNDVVTITTGGNVGIGTTNPGGYKLYVNGSLYASSYYCASDIRLKRDIQELNGTLEKVMNLHPISFVWNEKSEKAGKKDIGISGQEIEKYFPELVFKNDDGYISVDYSKLSVVAISAIKEQQKIIEEQAQKIKILEEKIKELESKIEKR
jgi:hypothetical protein